MKNERFWLGESSGYSGKALLCCLVFTCAFGTASAQVSDGKREIEEVVVSAQKRGDATLMDTSINIQAFGEQELEDRLVTDFRDLAIAIPSLQIQDQNGPGDREYVMRGINSSGDSTVGVYYDEAVITGSNFNNGGGQNAPIQMHDMQRVEVLKGPQGTLYGANSMSGTIRFVTNKPTMNEFEGYLEGQGYLTEHGDESFDMNGMINIPIIEDELALRAVGWVHRIGGYIDAIRIESGPIDDINSEDTEGARVHLRWTPGDNWTLLASHTYQELETGGSSRFMEGTSSDLSVIGFPPVEAGYLENTTFTQDKWDDKLNISSLTVDYESRVGVFTATTNYFSRSLLFRHDQTDVTASNPFFANFFPEPFQATLPIERDVWATEIRFASQLEDSPIQFVVGAFHNQDNTDWKIQTMNVDENGVAFPFTPGTDDDVGSGGNTVYGGYRNTDIRELAVFGEATYSFLDNFQLLLGGRWFESDFESDEALTHPFFFTDVVPFVVDSVESTASDENWKITLSWFPTDNLRLFATRSTGSRRGGLNVAGLPFEEFAIPAGFGPDELVNYEVGVKSRLLDGRLDVNITGYHMQWDDIQLEGTDAVGVYNFIGNFGEAEVNGVEFESTLLLADRLRISAAWSYQDAELTEDTPDLGENIPRGTAGDTIPNVPDFQGNMSIQYDQPMWGDWTGQVRLDVIHRGDTQTEFNNDIARNTKLDSYTLLNANFSLIQFDSGWRVNLFAKNLTDELARVDAFGGDNRELAFVTVRPRTIGINVSKRFY